VQIRASSGKCNKPASAVFRRGHHLKEKKPNPGNLPAIMAKIALKGNCLEKPQSQRLRPQAEMLPGANKELKKAGAFFNTIL